MYKGETQCYDSIESVGIGSPALMSQTKMIRYSNLKNIIDIEEWFPNRSSDNLERQVDNQERLDDSRERRNL